jgi:EAL domain-containing protein (putative c-di-GMP-specific phosphodiesterase class I)
VAEPFKSFIDKSKRDKRWIKPPLLTSGTEFSPQGGDSQRLLDVSSQRELDLREALRQQTLGVAYQPQFELDSGRGCGVEALARWSRANGEDVAPSVFIPLAERAGMIHELGAWILQSACGAASGWCNRDSRLTTLSVNVSALQIDEQFSTVIARALNQSKFPAHRLELEITESALIANPTAAIEHLEEWKKLGVRIALDDFGAGYSSLNYLSRMPVDRLKLDRSLIQRMTLDRKSAAVMRSVVSLGAELGMDVIAEGVETEVQLQMLAELGCPQAQGYLLGRPMTAEQAQLALSKPWGNRPIRPTDRASAAASRWPTHAF